MHNRRSLLVAVAAAALVGTSAAHAGPVRRGARRTVRRTTRRVRRRHRRRATRRVVAGRSMLVVPVATAVGWELMLDNKVYVVQSSQMDGNVEVLVLKASDGTTTTTAIVREDTADNATELGGSEIAAGDTTTPGYDDEISE